MIPNKSLDLKFPDISPLLYPHFIRGYFDGDGSIYINKQKHRITVTITSTKQFCEKIKDITEKELGIFCGIYDASCHNGITKVNSMSGKSAVKFLDWIYKDADLYMERKYNKYCEYILNK